jgi:hypothetical protein
LPIAHNSSPITGFSNRRTATPAQFKFGGIFFLAPGTALRATAGARRFMLGDRRQRRFKMAFLVNPYFRTSVGKRDLPERAARVLIQYTRGDAGTLQAVKQEIGVGEVGRAIHPLHE